MCTKHSLILFNVSAASTEMIAKDAEVRESENSNVFPKILESARAREYPQWIRGYERKDGRLRNQEMVRNHEGTLLHLPSYRTISGR